MLKPKVFFIAPALSMGGMERASANTANGLHQLGCEVIFLVLFKKAHFFKLVHEIKVLEPDEFNVSSLSLHKSIQWIRKEIKKSNPDKIIVFNKLYGAITALSLIGTKYNFYLSERSSPLYRWRFPFNIINFIAYTLNPPEGVIAQTQLAAEYQRTFFKKSKIAIIPNSVRDVQLFPAVRREKIILAVGRLNDHLKGFDLLLESIALLKNQDWQLHIAGGDENGIDLKKQAQKLGINHRVKFLGQVKDVDRCYAYSGIYVIPSRSEGFPNALAEAMAAGCCCVAFDFIAGPRELINNGVDGIIVENGNTLDLSKNIDNLILNPEYRILLGKEALLVRERLNILSITKKILNFIN